MHAFRVDYSLCDRFYDTFHAGELAENARTERGLVLKFTLQTTEDHLVWNLVIVITHELVCELERFLIYISEIIIQI